MHRTTDPKVVAAAGGNACNQKQQHEFDDHPLVEFLLDVSSQQQYLVHPKGKGRYHIYIATAAAS
jgi:hypothetical protein